MAFAAGSAAFPGTDGVDGAEESTPGSFVGNGFDAVGWEDDGSPAEVATDCVPVASPLWFNVVAWPKCS